MRDKDNLPVPRTAFMVVEAHASELVSREQLATAKASMLPGERVSEALIRLGFLKESDAVAFIARQFGVMSVDLEASDISTDVIRLIPKDLAIRHSAVPLKREGRRLTVALSDPGDHEAIKDLQFRTGLEIDVVVASDTAIIRVLDLIHNRQDLTQTWGRELKDLSVTVGDFADTEGEVDVAALEAQTKEAKIVDLAEAILTRAVVSRASDIHLEPYRGRCRLRLRIDGELVEVLRIDPKIYPLLSSRMKVSARMNLAERRQPQDGRIRIEFQESGAKKREVDFRVSTMPTPHGEKVVLRLLDKSALNLGLDALITNKAQLAQFRGAIHCPHGIVLVTGPTGSGKTTTLYGALRELNTFKDNIVTAEDPIEMEIEGLNQTEVNPVIGLSFASILRAMLRQDPDVVMVGEIRDFETAEIAIQAALTGHLVLSTLHTNSAADTVMRLMNLGIEPFLISSSLRLVCAQRLVRCLCGGCKRVEKVSSATLEEIGFSPEEIVDLKTYHQIGCLQCNKTGYRGRAGIYEMMAVGPELRELIATHSDAGVLQREARRLGMHTLRESGLDLIRKGVTSVDEVVNATTSD